MDAANRLRRTNMYTQQRPFQQEPMTGLPAGILLSPRYEAPGALEQRVDERGNRLPAHDQQAQQKKDENHRNNPPSLIMPSEQPEFLQQTKKMLKKTHNDALCSSPSIA